MSLPNNVFLSAICHSVADLMPEQAVVLIFNILLGRDPDDGNLSYYAARMGGTLSEKIGVLQELASSEEGRRFGILGDGVFSEVSGTLDLDAPATPAILLASIGKAARRLNEQGEKARDMEHLARLTLLSVPEWCGSAYDRLERRIAELERLAADASLV